MLFLVTRANGSFYKYFLLLCVCGFSQGLRFALQEDDFDIPLGEYSDDDDDDDDDDDAQSSGARRSNSKQSGVSQPELSSLYLDTIRCNFLFLCCIFFLCINPNHMCFLCSRRRKKKRKSLHISILSSKSGRPSAKTSAKRSS